MDRPVSVSADAKSYNIGIGSEVQKAGSGHPYPVLGKCSGGHYDVAMGAFLSPTDKGFLRPIPIQIFGHLKILYSDMSVDIYLKKKF